MEGMVNLDIENELPLQEVPKEEFTSNKNKKTQKKVEVPE